MLLGEDRPDGEVDQAHDAYEDFLQDLLPFSTFVIQAMLVEDKSKNNNSD